MLLIRRLVRAVCIVVALTVSDGPVLAQATDLERPPPPGTVSPQRAGEPPDPADVGGEAGHGQAGIRIGYHGSDDSGDGNPFLDEELTVIEPILMFSYNVTDRSSVWGQFSYDNVSSASIDRLSNYPQQSGASGDNYFGLDLGWRSKTDAGSRFGLFGHYSLEYDYQSIGLGGDYAFDLADKNATVQASLSGFFDTIDVIRADGTEDGTDDRLSLASTLTWYQIFTPKTHGSLGLTVGHQNGFLETPYNPVVIEDSNTPIPFLENARGTLASEELPDNRTRVAIFGQTRTSLSDRLAVQLGGRIYADSWGITSFAVEPRLYYWLWPDVLRSRLRYRFYVQTEADDYQEHFFTLESERTQDSDLGGFDSHTVGVQFTWSPTTSSQLDLSGDYVLRSDGLDQIIASLGWSWSF